jgi:hypothetical protein
MLETIPIALMKNMSVNIRKLKDFAFERLPQTSYLRQIILSENEQLSFAEFLAKLNVWMRLLRLESREHPSTYAHNPTTEVK